MKKFLIIGLLVILTLPLNGHATIWTYSGISQDSYDINGIAHDVYISMRISDRLYDFHTNQYVDLNPGDLIPSSPVVGFRITEAYIDIIGVEQITASGGALGFTWDFEPRIGSLVMDEIYLLSQNGDWHGLYFDSSGWQDYQGNLWNYADPTSPTYGQLAPVISAGAYYPIEFYGDFTFIRSPTSASPEPVPEPATILLGILGMLGLGFLRKMQFRS